MDNNALFEDLIKDTSFVMANSGSLMHSRIKIPTPLYVVNDIFGGGIPLGIISEISGPPGSGKSTFSYQTAGIFQRTVPNGIVIILDQESSMDVSRLVTLGVDPKMVLRLPATTMENAFKNLFMILEKVKSKIDNGEITQLYVIYDTISTGGTDKQHQATLDGRSVMNAGGMQEAARILKQNIANIFPYLEMIPIHFSMLNQVFTQMGTYTSSVASGGGYGLKHGAHLHINFSKGTEVSDNSQYKGFLTHNKGSINLNKSKLSPKFTDIPCNIDIRRGGVIDEVGSFVEYVSRSNIDIVTMGSWYNIKNTLPVMIEKYGIDPSMVSKYEKNYRKDDFYNMVRDDEDLLLMLQVRLIDFINEIYPGQKEVNEDYKEELMNRCRILKNSDPNSEEEIKDDTVQ